VRQDTPEVRLGTSQASQSLLPLGVLTLLAFALRLALLDQGLFGDELWTYRIVTENDLAGVFSDVYDTNEITPPLHFVLSWGAGQIGDSTIWIRVPSLIFGTATIPVAYLLGRRVFGEATGLLAGALLALSPFAIFYSIEARGYATMAFLVALSTLALLKALDGGRGTWWIVYAVSACAALYTHYMAVFAVVAQAGWAFWAYRDRLRTLAIVHAAIVLAYLPWLPGYLEQRQKSEIIEGQGPPDPLSVGSFFDYRLRSMVGQPAAGLGDMPGRAWVVLLVLAVVAAIAAQVPMRRGDRERGGRTAPAVVLMWIVALATPLGALTYSLAGPDVYAPKNLNASVPAIAVVVASALASLRPRWVAAAATAVVVVYVVGAAKSLDEDHRRPDYREVARFIDSRAAPGDTILDLARSQLIVGASSPSFVTPYFDGRRSAFLADEEGAAWEPALRGRSVFVVRAEGGLFAGMPPLDGPGKRIVRRDFEAYPGSVRLTVGRYQGEVEGTLRTREGARVISWSLGRDLVVDDGSARGFVDAVAADPAPFTLRGWATDAKAEGVADWVLAFSGGRLLSAGWPSVIRVDVAKAYGQPVLLAGYELTAPPGTGHPIDPSKVHVFAVVGGRASELELTDDAAREVRNWSGA
jgi:mannosyltransferase